MTFVIPTKPASVHEWARTFFEIALVLALGLLSFMGLAIYDMHVINQQRDLIRQMQSSPGCMNAPGGDHG